MFPVDFPDVEEDLTSVSQRYLSALQSGAVKEETFSSSDSSQVPISPCNLLWLQVFDDVLPSHSVLALHAPDDRTRVLALFLQDCWWSVEDVLRTSRGSRRGLVRVRSICERLVVFLLSRVVERRPGEEPLFSLHSRSESCQVLWSDGRAVGFYSVKRKGALCRSWSGCCYLLPVLDSVQVRRSFRRRGHALHMLHHFCCSFPDDRWLGISSPVSPGMAAVLLKFLSLHQQQRQRLYEVQPPGFWTQRRNIWLGLQLDRYCPVS